MNILLINFLLYLSYTLWGLKKCHYLTVHNMVSLWFTFISLMGLITVHLGIYQAVFGPIHIDDISPYLYCYICFIFLLLPLRKLNYKYIELRGLSQVKGDKFKKFSYFPLLVLLIYIIVLVPDVVIAFSMDNISDVYTELRKEGADLYQHGTAVNMALWIGRKFYNWFWAIFAFFAIYSLNKWNNNNKLYFIILFLSAVVPYFLRTIIAGGRGGFVFFSIQIMIVLLPIWPYLNNVLKKRILLFSSVFIGVVMVYLVAMTVARLEDSVSETPFTSVLRYFGEPYPNLGNNLWEHVRHHLMGRRMFPELFGFEKSELTQYENFALWQDYSGVAVLNYKTIFGDFYLEFGTLPAICIVACIGVLMNLYLKHRTLYFHQVPLYSYYVVLCSTAPLWFNLRNVGDLLVIIQLLIVGYVLKRYFLNKKHNNENRNYYDS